MEQINIYKGSSITFENKDGKVMVNATQMAKAFGKQPIDWLKTEQSIGFIETYSKLKNIKRCL